MMDPQTCHKVFPTQKVGHPGKDVGVHLPSSQTYYNTHDTSPYIYGMHYP